MAIAAIAMTMNRIRFRSMENLIADAIPRIKLK
jgi:hypothetical protein